MHDVNRDEGAYDCGSFPCALHEASLGASCPPFVLSSHLALIAQSLLINDGAG
jgi:hypothetical protein